MSNIDLSSESLGKRTSSIFCDVLAVDAATKTERICTENTILEPMAKVLRTLKIYGATEEGAIELDVNSYDSEDGDFYVYNIDNVSPSPHEDLRMNYVVLSGVHFSHSSFMPVMRFSIEDDGSLFVAHRLESEVVYVVGKLENYQGTLDDIQGAIDTNQARNYFSSLGWTNADTGEPSFQNLGVQNMFLGSTYKLVTIKIKKSVVERAINAEGKLQEDEDDLAVNLEKLSLAFPDYNNLVDVTEKYKTTKLRNKQLVSSRGIFESIVCSLPNGPLFQLKLGNGSIGTMLETAAATAPSWRMRPKDSDEVTVPLSSLADLSFSLGNVPICTSHDRYLGNQIMPGGYLPIAYTGIVPLEVVFALDNSIDEFSEDEDIYHRIVSSIAQRNDRTNRNDQHVERLPDRVTVRLVFVQVILEGVQFHLDLLRIPTDDEEGEDKTENMSEEVEEEEAEEEEEAPAAPAAAEGNPAESNDQE